MMVLSDSLKSEPPILCAATIELRGRVTALFDRTISPQIDEEGIRVSPQSTEPAANDDGMLFDIASIAESDVARSGIFDAVQENRLCQLTIEQDFAQSA